MAEMFEHEDLPVTTTDGRRPSTTVGDRLMVILAALALVGGALIAVGKLLPPSEATETGEASATPAEATPAASATVRPTPSPRPLRSFQLTAGVPPTPPAAQDGFSGWVRALEDVPIRYSPSEDGSIVDTLSAGEAAYVEQPSDDDAGRGWLHVSEPLSAWIHGEIDGRQVLDYADARDASTGWLDRLVAGPAGFAALGGDPARPGYGTVLAGSSDGRVWRQSDHDFGEAWGSSLGYGPAGWLLVQSISVGEFGGSEAWILRSDDLLSWQPLGSLDSAAGEPGQLVASEAGYVMLANWSNGYGSGAASVWFSTDGVVWSERIRPRSVLSGEIRSLSATQLGFFAYGSDDKGAELGYFSADGWTWTAMSPERFEDLAGVVAAGDHLLAVDSMPDGKPRAWLGTFTGDELAWAPDASSTEAFEGAVVASLVSDGVTAMAIGWDRQTERALYWIRTSSSWDRRAFPADYAGRPRIAAAGPAGYVVGGLQPGALGLDPVVWHFAAGTWMPQTTGPIRAAPVPTTEECSSLGTDLIDLMSTNSLLYVTCFGDAPLTIRGWLHPCQDCHNAIWGAEPRWLAEPSIERVFNLAPMVDEGVSWLEGVLSRSLRRDPNRAWEGDLLEVTGHFDDPAASRCRMRQGQTYDYWDGGRQEIVNQCRIRFVVTSVRVLPAP